MEMDELVTVSLGTFYYFSLLLLSIIKHNFSRVMLGGFPLIIPNDPVMKMKIEEKAFHLMKNTIEK